MFQGKFDVIMHNANSYYLADVIKVALLQVASVLVHWLWSKSIDPDNAAIPYLTSLGDLLGGALLALSFHLYYSSSTLNSEDLQNVTQAV